MAIIEIEDLPSTALPNLLHEFAAQKDGLTVKLRVQQVYDLILAAMQSGAPSNMNTFDEISASLADDPAFAATMASALGLKGNKVSDTFTTPTINKPTINDPSGLLLHGHIFGCITSNDTGDLTNDIRVEAGECASVVSPYALMKNTTKQTKRLDALWSVGDNNGGLDQGSIANASYHFHRIYDPVNDIVDHIFSLSHDEAMSATITVASPAVVTASNHGLVAGSPIKFSTNGSLPTGILAGTQYYVIASGLTDNAFQFSLTNGGSAVNSSGTQSGVHTLMPGPKLPTGYTHYRRIMSIRRVGGALELYTQEEDVFTRNSPTTDRNAINAFTDTLHVLGVPTGVKVYPFGHSSVGCNANGNVVFQIGSVKAATAAITSSQTAAGAGGGALVTSPFPPIFMTDRSARLYFSFVISGGTATANIEVTTGWVDTRGRIR
ncbi:hypothetical protein HQ945_08285 [Phyllobacterium sp. BT25]|uniref:Uncharacterized protein n=1 Tax=Phyllobacterium pellucidum TaxID=2740464 RepID=A0A849VN41_9HYPH|nr:hypothetical protein [Phyllobacterium pellucidum]NTS31251.1 hypothetical protein [Phyllobacterium pellucidum]